LGSLSPKLVPHLHPIVPIFNSFPCLSVRGFDGDELGQWNYQAISFPPDHNKHFILALIFRSHAEDVNFIFDLQWRNSTLRAANCRERKLKLLFEIIIPSHRLPFRPVSVDDDLHPYAFFSVLILSWLSLGHVLPLSGGINSQFLMGL